jgi:hypothetical protein
MESTDPKESIGERWARIGQDWEWLSSILPCEMAQHGDELRGVSVAPKGNQWLMTVRVTINGIPSVVFTCTGTPTACVASFRKRWEAETLQLFPDRYA